MPKKNFFYCLTFCLIISCSILPQFEKNQNRLVADLYNLKNNLQTSITNLEILEDIFASKEDQFNNLGYFNNIYESSLQATYYSLYILESLDCLKQFETQQILDYIMSHYDSKTNLFSDKLSDRYLDTSDLNFSLPWSSLLEVNCYAILSLEILESLMLINETKMIDFIWSCYNPEEGGFIGRPYNSVLEPYFKLSTMEKTFFAINTLDKLLNHDWNNYIEERDELRMYIEKLQYITGTIEYLGGFRNDQNDNFRSLHIFEPNMMSAYYSIKSLQIIGLEDTINTALFNDWINNMYNSSDNYFHLCWYDLNLNLTNLVSTSMGYELSKITNYMGINGNEDKIVNFIINNRNLLGGWDQSTTIDIHELIDTYQIIRSLRDTEELASKLIIIKNGIITYLSLFYNDNGYCLLSNDYLSIDLVHSIISSYYEYDMITNLDIQELYNMIENCFNSANFTTYNEKVLHCGFNAYNNYYQDEDQEYQNLRSYPIEYYFGWGGHNNLEEIGFIYSPKTTYKALDSLNKLFKLDDFALDHSLMDIINCIIDCQFLDSNYERNGGFLHYNLYNHIWPSNILNEHIYLENAFYAIKSLELLSNFLSLGEISSLGLDIKALHSYILGGLIESSNYIYFQPIYSSNIDLILQNTYYMIYILNSINSYNLTNYKIENYILDNLNYNSIKNIYYSYKILNILDLDFEFKVNLTHQLVQDIYNNDLKEFYLTKDQDNIDQDVFHWLVDISKNDKVRIESHMDKYAKLGSFNFINISLCNLILETFDQYTVVKFENKDLGVIPLDYIDPGYYQYKIYIPISSDYFPTIDSVIRVYDKGIIISENSFIFETIYDIDTQTHFMNISKGIKYEIQASLKFGDEIERPAYNSYMLLYVYKNGEFHNQKNFTRNDFLNHSEFSMEYIFKSSGEFKFEVYFKDYINSKLQLISVNNYIYKGKNDGIKRNINIGVIPLVLIFAGVLFTLIMFTVRKKLKLKEKFN